MWSSGSKRTRFFVRGVPSWRPCDSEECLFTRGRGDDDREMEGEGVGRVATAVFSSLLKELRSPWPSSTVLASVVLSWSSLDMSHGGHRTMDTIRELC